MNILSATNALKGIKLKELDDEFQIAIMNAVNNAFPDTVRICGDSTGELMRQLIDNELPVVARSELMRSAIFNEPNDIVRFFNNVERIQEAHQQAIVYDDAIKGNFITNLGLLAIIVVVVLVGLYVFTEDTRGKVPDSKVAQIATKIVDALIATPTIPTQVTQNEEP